MTVYIIGGSPCSGKSTVAQAMAEQYGLHYFKVDDHLDRYMQMGAAQGKACCAAVAHMSPEEIWMRAPQVQCAEELQIYREIYGYILQDLEPLATGHDVITEGAAYLPALVREQGVPFCRYLSITPTKEFQVLHYRRREWVPHVLEGCSDKTAAFSNWMERDALFAEAVRRQCSALGYASLVNNGSTSVDELIHRAAAHFGLE